MPRPKSWGDAPVESTAGSYRSARSATKKESPGAVHTKWNINRSSRPNEPQFQDNVGTLDRIDKSIWDLAKGVKQDQHSQHSLLVRWTWARVKQDARSLLQTLRSHPLVALVPLLLWMLMVGGGIYAVVGSANRESRHRHQLAAQIASDKAMFLSTELAKVFMPAYVCSVYVRRDPRWPAVNASFEPMALEMIRLSNAGSILTLSLIPNGVIYTMVPLNGSSPAHDPNWRAIGKDWLQDKFNEDKVLRAIDTEELTIIGPYNLTQGGIGLVAMLSIRIPNTVADNTFDIPPYIHGALGPWQQPPRVQRGPNTTDTPFAPYMYDNRTGSKWWGLTTVLISWDTLRERVARLQDLEALGYRYVLSRPALQKELLRARPDLADGTLHELAVAWSSAVQAVPAAATNNNVKPSRPGEARPLVYYDMHRRLREPVVAQVLMEGAQMSLYLEPLDGWVPGWRDPLLAVVALGSLAVAGLVFSALVSRRMHLALLHAMIPKKVISTISRGEIFTESFDCVTILFSDIVSYTSMSAQMAPIEVVQMLDELYKEYDNLTEKHQLYKVETIGDAFMVVGGAPEPLEAVEAARRVAQMALDMVELTRTRVLSGGQVLRIRVGIHSGPVVAAVVGRKMPRYCLFGDTVNTASRMESNGGPMRVHVSAATADLLREAGGFVLEARGEVPIKGKGSMSTYWVSGTASGAAAAEVSLDLSVSSVQQEQLRSPRFSQAFSPPPAMRPPTWSASEDAEGRTSVGATQSTQLTQSPQLPVVQLQPSPRHQEQVPVPVSADWSSRPQPQPSSSSPLVRPFPPSSASRLGSQSPRRDLESASEVCRDVERLPSKPMSKSVRLMAASPLRVSSGQVIPMVVSDRRDSVELVEASPTGDLPALMQTYSSLT